VVQSVSCKNMKMEKNSERESEVKRQKIKRSEVEGEKEEGTSSGKKYVLLAAK